MQRRLDTDTEVSLSMKTLIQNWIKMHYIRPQSFCHMNGEGYFVHLLSLN